MLLRSCRRAYRPAAGCRLASTWALDATRPDNLVQCYTSSVNDPFLNLSIEHYLLEKTPPRSAILFLYINRPCVVIGRNQNPWSEVNLEALWTDSSPLGRVELVRRRSGGGTVFHDEGNVNWTVISPSDTFTRDKHAEMVVRALRQHGVERARVNERHDIVLDQATQRGFHDPNDLHRTPFTSEDPSVRPVKVSGSAYKLTRGRALHHGTCLLTSPNLANLSHLLRSPARNYIRAKGVESVRSPVCNVGLGIDLFKQAVAEKFAGMYDTPIAAPRVVGLDALEVPEIVKGNDELHSPEWLWDQTPGFTLSSQAMSDTKLVEESPQQTLPPTITVQIDFKHGQITETSLASSDRPDRPGISATETALFQQILRQRRLRDPWTWGGLIGESKLGMAASEQALLATWLQKMIPRPDVNR